MNLPSLEDIKTSIRKHHGLADDADVRVRQFSSAVDMQDSHKFTARITTDALDLDREVILPQGVNASRFLKSGAVFWNHDYNQPVAYPQKFIMGERYVENAALFMKRPEDYQGHFFPDFARAFVMQSKAAGLFPGVSVGFAPVECRNPTAKDYSMFGSDVQRVHSKIQLLEWSIAPVQCNPDAVVTAVHKGVMERNIAKSFYAVEVPEGNPVSIVVPAMPEKAAPRRKLVILWEDEVPEASKSALSLKSIDLMVTKGFKQALDRECGVLYSEK